MIRGGSVLLYVGDLGRALRFYIETLGMKLLEEHPNVAIIDAGDGFRIGLRTGGAPGSGVLVVLHAKVPIEEAVAIYENRGVAFTIERSETGTLAHFNDPDANALCLVASPDAA